MSSYDELRDIVRGIAERFEDLWIEREFLKDHVVTQYHVPASFLDALLESAKESPKWRTAAYQASELLRKALEDKTFEIALREQDENPPKGGKPN
jgi:hypothetical protein